MRNRKLAITMALGALAAGCYAGFRRSQALSSRPAAKPEHLQTWEGEGGGVPVDAHHIASQVEPQERPGYREDTAPGPADGSPASLRDSSTATALGDAASRNSALR
ncbi:MAG: hypothetical protein H0W40_04690 [Methylibium sp.]|uniref:hypothetical protein n=1 Tax=Methylibium sp. TaxID=2067992 RepID=UPI0017C5DA36|nr:hypothetical protein [Methylibium sp.]MBA3596660.1 hypothetical protein [Methylibium sp.]